jgi:D-alanyl-D-alanine dipeptidase
LKKICYSSRLKNYASCILIFQFIFYFNFTSFSQNDTDLVVIQNYIPNCILDIRYASNYNFTRKSVYKKAIAAGRFKMVKMLKQVNDSLQKLKLKLVIFDAYRPSDAQYILWNHFPDKRYVSPPEKGSRHSRGVAIDCSIADSIGNLLPMPSLYDTFGRESHIHYQHQDSYRNTNRDFLQSIMQYFGFVSTNSEWWHFELKNPYQYKILNIPLENIH